MPNRHLDASTNYRPRSVFKEDSQTQAAEMNILALRRSSQRECNGHAMGLQSRTAGNQRAAKTLHYSGLHIQRMRIFKKSFQTNGAPARIRGHGRCHELLLQRARDCKAKSLRDRD